MNEFFQQAVNFAESYGPTAKHASADLHSDAKKLAGRAATAPSFVFGAFEEISQEVHDALARLQPHPSPAHEIQKEPTPMTTPIAVAGLADTVKNAVAGMARAKVSADALNASASRLVNNIASVDNIKSQLDAANAELEGAVAQVGGPLVDTPAVSTGSASVPASAGATASGTSIPQSVQAAADQVAAANAANTAVGH